MRKSIYTASTIYSRSRLVYHSFPPKKRCAYTWKGWPLSRTLSRTSAPATAPSSSGQNSHQLKSRGGSISRSMSMSPFWTTPVRKRKGLAGPIGGPTAMRRSSATSELKDTCSIASFDPDRNIARRKRRISYDGISRLSQAYRTRRIRCCFAWMAAMMPSIPSKPLPSKRALLPFSLSSAIFAANPSPNGRIWPKRLDRNGKIVPERMSTPA